MNRHKHTCNALLITSIVLLFSTHSLAETPVASTSTADNESLLHSESSADHNLDVLTRNALHAISSGDWSSGLTEASKLVQAFPDYALGQWLLAEAHNVLSMSNTFLESQSNYSATLVGLLQEAQVRAQHKPQATTNNAIPSEIIQVGTHVDNVVVVDLKSSVLYQFDTSKAKPTLTKQHYISSGEGGFGKALEGDLKTPLGVYDITGFRDDKSLPDLYGSGALMLNYPNALDQSLGRTGSGIWLHGNPQHERSRAPRSSEGCVTMTNDYLLELHSQINLDKTHVILSHNLQWQSWSEQDRNRQRYQELFEQYKAAWLNSDVDDLFSLYLHDALPAHVKYSHLGTTKKVKYSNTTSPLSPTGVSLDQLSKIDAQSVSLIMNPDLGDENAENNENNRHLVMSFTLPSDEAVRVTLYWERESSTGYWRIKQESITNRDI